MSALSLNRTGAAYRPRPNPTKSLELIAPRQIGRASAPRNRGMPVQKTWRSADLPPLVYCELSLHERIPTGSRASAQEQTLCDAGQESNARSPWIGAWRRRARRRSQRSARTRQVGANSRRNTKRGWKDILLRIWKNIGKDRVVVVAAGVTFYSILALFPAIAALVALYGLFAEPSTIASHLDSIAGLVPGGAIEVMRDQITRVASQGRTALGLTFIVSLLVSLWSANAGMKSLFDALNLVYNESEKRGFFKLNLVSLTFTLLTIVFVMVAIGAVVVVPIVLNFLGLGGATELVVKIARWPALFVVVTLALAFLYRYGPSREKARWRWLTWGSVFAAVGWLVVSILFSWYAENFGNYNKTYGSLGAIIAFMFWLWLSIIVVLIGGELNAETEHQTVHDTTTGAPRPLGRARCDDGGHGRSGAGLIATTFAASNVAAVRPDTNPITLSRRFGSRRYRGSAVMTN
ncbi:MAG: YihY/virulence factor BrkB family protein [Xanthobacteraceae bacterium]